MKNVTHSVFALLGMIVVLAASGASAQAGNVKKMKGMKFIADAAAASGVTASMYYNKAHSDYLTKVKQGKIAAGKTR